MNKEKISYTAASAFPVKIFFNEELMKKLVKAKKIPPIHVQLNPTNRCNLNCPFCSCSARDKTIEMPFREILKVMGKFKDLGCESVTITGGGEPLMHENIDLILWALNRLGIQVGLVTNGILLDKLTEEDLSNVIWCRISLGNHRKWTATYVETLKKAVERGKNIDWAFSYVVEKPPNIDLIRDMIEFANEHDFTHVRLVSDIFIAKEINLQCLKNKLGELGVDDSRVIYQDRGTWTKGAEKCWISLLKPVVSADGKIFPCCGSQYMFKNPKRDYEGAMGSVDEIEEIWASQKHFDGSQCDKCYYNHYNELLDILLSDIKHIKFI